MRLIDADLLKKNCKCTGDFKDNFIGVDIMTLASVIDNQPTVTNNLDTFILNLCDVVNDEMGKFSSLLKNGTGQPKWKSVNNPPTESKWVLVCFNDETAIPEVSHYNALCGYEGFHNAYTEGLLQNVAFWADLPKTPFENLKK